LRGAGGGIKDFVTTILKLRGFAYRFIVSKKTHNQIVGLSHDLIVAVAFVVIEEVIGKIPAFIPPDAKYSGLG